MCTRETMGEETDYSFDCSVDNPGERITFIQAELALREKEALEAIKGDICDWLSRTLDLTIHGQSFLDTLDTGVAVCKLATLIQQAAKEIQTKERPLKVKVPTKPLSCNAKAGRGTFFARDNTSNFISWCRDLGVEEAVVFESNGLVDHSDEKRVVLCLLDVARFADRVGISPPELVRMEREIEELEARELEDTSQPTSNDDQLQELSLLSPQTPTVQVPPTENVVRLPPTENVVQVPPTENTVQAPPTENTVQAPPTENTVPLPPTENTVQAPPTENAVQAPPTENIGPLPPTENTVQAPPTENTVPLPPTEAELSSKRSPSPVSGTTQDKTTLATQHTHPIRARSQSPVKPTKSPFTRTRSTKIPSPVHSSTRPRQTAPSKTSSPPAHSSARPTSSKTVPSKTSSPPAHSSARPSSKTVASSSPPVRVYRGKREREDEDTQHKNKRQRGETEERKNESVDEKVMRRVDECTCSNKFQVTSCGKGKFIVQGSSGRKMTVYARLLSDRVMVRVGGGWDSLDHFLLKHDPCRIHAITLAGKKTKKVTTEVIRSVSPQDFLRASHH